MTTKVKGAVILSRRAFVRQEYGDAGWEAVLDGLPPEDQETLRGFVLSVDWYPFDLNERLDAAIVETLGKGDPKIFETIGAWSARENLGGPHQHFLSPGEPQQFLGKTDRIYRFYYDTGRRDYEASGATAGVMTTYESETLSATDCLTVIGWYKEALAMCGARGVEMVEETCRAKGGDVCRYRISWQAVEPAT